MLVGEQHGPDRSRRASAAAAAEWSHLDTPRWVTTTWSPVWRGVAEEWQPMMLDSSANQAAWLIKCSLVYHTTIILFNHGQS